MPTGNATFTATRVLVAVGVAQDQSPTLTVASLSTPSPGVRVVVTGRAADSSYATVYRTDAQSGKVTVRGAQQQVMAGTFTVDDFEAPLSIPLVYTAITHKADGTPSDESAGQTITLSSTSSWLTNPLDPTQALTVRIADDPWTEQDIEAVFLLPIGSAAPNMISGTRQTASARPLMLYTATLSDLSSLRALLSSAPVLLLRTYDTTWDIGAIFVGSARITTKRTSKMLAEPSRYVLLDARAVARPDPSVEGPLYTYADLTGHGYVYAQVVAAGATYLRLAQNGGL